jgi:hypothetical protein
MLQPARKEAGRCSTEGEMVTVKGTTALILIAVSLAGCNGARSTSNSGYPDGDDHRRQIYPDMAYRDRAAADQDQVDDLKRQGYAALARQIGEQAPLASM